MYSNGDLEQFYFQYPTEAMPKGISVEQFCSRNKVPYNIFYKYYKDTCNELVEVEVNCLSSSSQEKPKVKRHLEESSSTEAKTFSVRILVYEQWYLSQFFTKIFSGCRDFVSLRYDKIGLAVCQ